MKAPSRSRFALLAGVIAVLALSVTALAQGQGADGDTSLPDEGVLVRVSGDVNVAQGEEIGVLVVVDGTAAIAGEVATLVAVRSDVVMQDARVGDVVVVDGTLRLAGGTLVQGDVSLVTSTLTQEPGSTVQGTIQEEAPWSFAPAWIALFGLVIVGFSLAVLVAGLVGAAVAPRQFRAASAVLRQDLGGMLIGAIAIWIGLPLLAALAIGTIVGIPLGLGILLVLLPLLWFLGYIVVGVRLGEALLGRGARQARLHPYMAATVGILVLLVLTWIPFVGAAVAIIAGIVGAGAIAYVAWRSTISTGDAGRRGTTPTSPP